LEQHFAYNFALDYSFTLKMTSVYFSKTSVSIYPTTRCHIPDNSNHINHRSENISSLFVASLPGLKSQPSDAVASRHVTETQILPRHLLRKHM